MPHPEPPGECVNCGRPRKRDQFACPRCWFKLPSPLRDRIWKSYRRGARHHVERLPAFYAEAMEVWAGG